MDDGIKERGGLSKETTEAIGSNGTRAAVKVRGDGAGREVEDISDGKAEDRVTVGENQGCTGARLIVVVGGRWVNLGREKVNDGRRWARREGGEASDVGMARLDEGKGGGRSGGGSGGDESESVPPAPLPRERKKSRGWPGVECAGRVDGRCIPKNAAESARCVVRGRGEGWREGVRGLEGGSAARRGRRRRRGS